MALAKTQLRSRLSVCLELVELPSQSQLSWEQNKEKKAATDERRGKRGHGQLGQQLNNHNTPIHSLPKITWLAHCSTHVTQLQHLSLDGPGTFAMSHSKELRKTRRVAHKVRAEWGIAPSDGPTQVIFPMPRPDGASIHPETLTFSPAASSRV